MVNKNKNQMANKNKNQMTNKNSKNTKIVAKPVVSKPAPLKKSSIMTKSEPITSKAVELDESDSSDDDDISEEELKKMLGTSDNSDIDSDEFSEEEQIESKESKVNRKRKLTSSDDETDTKRSKIGKDEDEDEELDEDEDMDDSFIDDEEENSEDDDEENNEDDDEENNEDDDEESKENDETSIVEVPSPEKEKTTKKEKKIIDPEVLLKLKKDNHEKQEQQMALVKEMFIDTPKVDDEKLKKQIRDRLVSRKERTVVLSAVPHMFTVADIKTLVPNMVSCVMPYNAFFHRNVGTVYVDMKSAEEAAQVALRIHKTKQTVGKIVTGKLGAIVQTKIIDDVDKYNCQRLVVSNLHKNVKLDDLKETLPKATRIEMMPTKGIDRKSNKTAFAEYASVKEAIADYDSKHGIEIKGCPINLKFQIRNVDNVKTKQNHFDKKRLTLFGVKKNTRVEDIKKLFPQAIGISLTLEKGSATIKYSNEAECAVDKLNAIKNKPVKKWRISFAMGQTTAGVASGENESKQGLEKAKKFEGKKFEGKKFEGKKFEGKKFEGKKFEGKKFEGKKFEGKKSSSETSSAKHSDKKRNNPSKSDHVPAQLRGVKVRRGEGGSAKKSGGSDDPRDIRRQSKKQKNKLEFLKKIQERKLSEGKSRKSEMKTDIN